jgi:hypothetical protein
MYVRKFWKKIWRWPPDVQKQMKLPSLRSEHSPVDAITDLLFGDHLHGALKFGFWSGGRLAKNSLPIAVCGAAEGQMLPAHRFELRPTGSSYRPIASYISHWLRHRDLGCGFITADKRPHPTYDHNRKKKNCNFFNKINKTPNGLVVWDMGITSWNDWAILDSCGASNCGWTGGLECCWKAIALISLVDSTEYGGLLLRLPEHNL